MLIQCSANLLTNTYVIETAKLFQVLPHIWSWLIFRL